MAKRAPQNWKCSSETKLGHRFHLLDFLGFTNDSQIMWLISPLCGVIKNTKIDSFLLSHCWHSNPEPCVLYVSAPWLEKILIEKKSFRVVKNFEVWVKIWNLAEYLQHPNLWMWKFQQNINYLWELLLPQCRPQLKSPVIHFTKSKRKGKDSSFFGSKKGFLFQYCLIFTCQIVLAECE